MSDDEKESRCYHCGSALKPKAKKCPKCGLDQTHSCCPKPPDKVKA